ncbi:alpha/beta hydrolase [Deinococcus roseus]|uniref:Serine aminopeptidase S33 domain-containing protein n=1 Tax=Deinococcus roseus TaxID=392414 RepID=A0ABQ2DGI7_9DEIO|nr:alpha/beta fold hydrolase [Deinococcus roseus]GGJ54082.1 hypothetical protein GCM10008938_45170 [Deinococcus roseus]
MKKWLTLVLALCCTASALESHMVDTDEGSKIHLNYYAPEGTPKAAIVLLHSLRSNTCDYGTFPETLAAEGYAAIAVDLRIGASTGELCQNLTRASTTDIFDAFIDLEVAIQWIQQKTGLKQVILSGSSTSATMVLDYAGQHPELVKGVLAYSPASPDLDLTLEAIKYAPKIAAPVLMVSIEEEKGFPGQMLPLIGSTWKNLYIPKVGIHGAVGLVTPGMAEDYQKTTLDFLKGL